MTDKKFTGDEIIHSLKVCSNNGDCSECLINPHKGNYGYCTSLAIKAALDLINRQKNALEREIYNGLKADEEIEYLKSENARLITSNSQLEARACEDRAEIDRLNNVHADMNESLRLAAEANKDMTVELQALRGAANSYKMHYENAKAEAIKEFAERLTSDLGRIPQYHFTRLRVVWSIVTLVKEMTEEKENESKNT